MRILSIVVRMGAIVLVGLGVAGPRIAGASDAIVAGGAARQELELGLEGPAAAAAQCGAYAIGSAWGMVVDYGSNNFCSSSVEKIQAVRYLEYDNGQAWEVITAELSECVNCSGLQALGSVIVDRVGLYRTNTVYCVTNGDITCGIATKSFVVG